MRQEEAASETTENSEAAPASAVVRPEAKRWTEGDPQTQDYFHDEELPTRKLTKFENPSLFPPKMNLADAWVAIVLEAGFTIAVGARSMRRGHCARFGKIYQQALATKLLIFFRRPDRLPC